MLNSKEAYKKTVKAKQRKIKDIRYVLKYIDKQIKDACNQGMFYILLNNKVIRTRFFTNLSITISMNYQKQPIHYMLKAIR